MIGLTHTFLAAASDAEVIKLDRGLIFVGIVQSIIFILQLIVFGIQARKLDQTVKAAAKQSSDMKRSIQEETRAANAMEISGQSRDHCFRKCRCRHGAHRSAIEIIPVRYYTGWRVSRPSNQFGALESNLK